MRTINRVFLMGYAGSDAEMKVSKAGKQYTAINLATHRRTRSESGEVQTLTEWHRVTAWGKNAELCSLRVRKGVPLAIEGFITSYKSRLASGEERLKTSIWAQEVHFLGRAPQDSVEPFN